jgi:hypothetical protein
LNTGSFAFCQKKTPAMKQAGLKDILKKPSRSVCSSATGVSPDPLSPTQSSSALKIQKTQKRTLMTLNQQMKGISKWNTALVSCTAQV